MVIHQLLIIFLLCFSNQQATPGKIEIGKAVQNGYQITADTAVLTKALQRTLGDGTVITSMHIESVNAHHYLVGEGTYKTFYKMIGVILTYDINTRTYYAQANDGYVSCTSAACESCRTFKENGRIIGCKCDEKSTISNQCNFTSKPQSRFYFNYSYHLKLQTDKK